MGKGIDTGFRISKNSAEDRFIVSVQLGYCLAQASTRKIFPHPLTYHGRQTLKGVIDGAPYPIISVDTERSSLEREVRSREEAILGTAVQSPYAICDFLSVFMKANKIDVPLLWFDGEDRPFGLDEPPSYSAFRKQFDTSIATEAAQVAELKISTDPENPRKNALVDSEAFLRAVAKFSNSLNAYHQLPATKKKSEEAQGPNDMGPSGLSTDPD